MSFFSDALDRLLPEHDMSAAELARKSEVAPNYISRYRAGGRPEADALEKIADAFGSDGSELVVAWLRDSVPDKYRRRVSLAAQTESSVRQETTPAPWQQLGVRDQRLFEQLVERCLQNPKMLPLIRQILSTTAAD